MQKDVHISISILQSNSVAKYSLELSNLTHQERYRNVLLPAKQSILRHIPLSSQWPASWDAKKGRETSNSKCVCMSCMIHWNGKNIQYMLKRRSVCCEHYVYFGTISISFSISWNCFLMVTCRLCPPFVCRPCRMLHSHSICISQPTELNAIYMTLKKKSFNE